jgi:hypothetical protein
LPTGVIADRLYGALWWLALGGGGRAPQPELQPFLDRYGEFFVDYWWTYVGQPPPTPTLAAVAAELMRLYQSSAGWSSKTARDLLTVALDELEAAASQL